MSTIPQLAAVSFLVFSFAACGGKAISTSNGAPDAGPTSSGGSVTGTGTDAAATCVDVSASSFDQSCGQDSDCTNVSTGHLCDRTCVNCGGTAINVSSLPAYDEAIQSITSGDDCPCPFTGVPRCLQNECTLCGPNDECGDGGTITLDASATDAGVCVDIDLADYDQSCTQTSDCVDIMIGEVCDGNCGCGGGGAINVSAEGRYKQAISGIVFSDCPCLMGPTPTCVQGTCILCGEGDSAPGCPDGG